MYEMFCSDVGWEQERDVPCQLDANGDCTVCSYRRADHETPVPEEELAQESSQ